MVWLKIGEVRFCGGFGGWGDDFWRIFFWLMMFEWFDSEFFY
jgi:hypothetical protein